MTAFSSSNFAIFGLLASAIVSITNATCPSYQPEGACEHVSTWTELKNTIENSLRGVCFDGFDISKNDDDEAIAIHGRNVTISCQSSKKCRINGGGRHMSIVGGRSKITISGFTFEGATDTAVNVEGKRGLKTFCGCTFVRNGLSGAIKGSSQSLILVRSCSFLENSADSGSGIYFKGKTLEVVDSSFKQNIGSAVHCKISQHAKFDRTCFLQGNEFLENHVSSMDFLDGSGLNKRGTLHVVDRGGNIASGQTGCNGVLDIEKGQCLQFLSVVKGLMISPGISGRLVARAGEPVAFTSRDAVATESSVLFHTMPDGAATFSLEDGGWAYVSNSEAPGNSGGAFAIHFDRFGEAMDYKMLLGGTTRNCSGGKTPHHSWISCEETEGGHCWQVDPTGETESERTLLGGQIGGRFESVAVDDRNPSRPIYFVTEDKTNGALRKYTAPEGSTGWNSLHENGGEIEYLNFLSNNRFEWTKSFALGKASAFDNYQNTEGISYRNGKLYFVAKKIRKLFILDLDSNTYEVEHTNTGLFGTKGDFSGQPAQIVSGGSEFMCFTEDGGSTAGVYCRNESGLYVTIFESDSPEYRGDETTGLALSPDKKWIYACLQDCGCNKEENPLKCGCCMEFWRHDGLPFNANTMNLRHLS